MTSFLITSPSTTALEAALHYVSQGCPVIPLHGAKAGVCSCGNVTCPAPGKHPRTANGVHDSTLDPSVIESWWKKWTDTNVGMALGQRAGMFALDVDAGKGGAQSLEALQERFGPLPPTLRQITGGGGFHLFFRYPAALGLKNSVGDLGAGLDVRAESGYCVVPPSLHASGREYAWDASSHIPTDAPEWLLERLVQRKAATRWGHAESSTDKILPGRRNTTLASCAGAMRRQGMGPNAIEQALLVDNSERCVPPLDDYEVTVIAGSISRYTPAIQECQEPVPLPDSKVPWRCSVELLKEAPLQTKWLVDEFIPTSSVVLLAAREGHMKTWLALEMAHGVGEGVDWVGRECLQGKALLIDGENPDDMLKQRLAATGESPNVYVWRWQDEGFPTSLGDPWLKRAAKEFDLLIIDTLKRFMPDLEENSATDMALITAQLRELTRYGASVVALHHAKKDGERPGYRGSSELGAGVDVIYFVEKSSMNGEEFLKITSAKDRYQPTSTFTLRIEKTEGGPVFKSIDGAQRAISLTSEGTDVLSELLTHLTTELQRPPNQSEIVRAAAAKGMGRGFVRRILLQGIGRYWEEVSCGKSKSYQVLPISSVVSPQGGRTEQDNGLRASGDQFISPGGIESDNGTDEECREIDASVSPKVPSYDLMGSLGQGVSQ